MQSSQKQNTFYEFFVVFSKSILNSKYCEQKDEPQSFCISDITDPKNMVRSMSKKSRFRRTFEKQHGKGAQGLLKSASQHLYHIHWSLATKLS